MQKQVVSSGPLLETYRPVHCSFRFCRNTCFKNIFDLETTDSCIRVFLTSKRCIGETDLTKAGLAGTEEKKVVHLLAFKELVCMIANSRVFDQHTLTLMQDYDPLYRVNHGD